MQLVNNLISKHLKNILVIVLVKLGKAKASTAEVEVLKTYKFHGIFPTNVSAIELSYDQSDSVEEFTVDLQVQWWDVYRGKDTSSFLTGNNANN